MGVAGFWNDMNEPSVFKRADKTMPLENVHRLDDGGTLDHRAVHNVFGLENVRATYDGLRKLQPDERPFVLTRAAYSGTGTVRGYVDRRQQRHVEPSVHEHADAAEPRDLRLLARGRRHWRALREHRRRTC